jgi:hypothetical protein
MFDTVIRDLSEKELRDLKEFISTSREDLLAARSEEARVRIVNDFVTELHDLRARPKRATTQ